MSVMVLSLAPRQALASWYCEAVSHAYQTIESNLTWQTQCSSWTPTAAPSGIWCAMLGGADVCYAALTAASLLRCQMLYGTAVVAGA